MSVDLRQRVQRRQRIGTNEVLALLKRHGKSGCARGQTIDGLGKPTMLDVALGQLAWRCMRLGLKLRRYVERRSIDRLESIV